nr:reverse transcriptase domain-containing protein [Tanacetum cinerariifolium]
KGHGPDTSHFMSQALQAPELNYTPMEKLVLALVCVAKRLRRYFQAHPIVVITGQPIKQVISCPDVAGRLQKWSVMLGEHNITYRPQTSVKGLILADFLAEKPDDAPPEASVIETPQEPWTLFTDGSSCVDGSGAGLILTSPKGTEFTYALRFQFIASNNEAKYEALIAGLRIAARMRVRNINVLVEVLKEKSIQEEEVATVVEEKGPTWMTPIMEYLKDGTPPGDRKEASKLRIKARTMVAKAMRLGYYWPTMHRDARDMIHMCNACQVHRPVPRNPQQPLTLIMAPWPFYKWGIDIAGPFPKGPEKVKLLIVAMDYFTKWIEAKTVVTITGSQVKKFVWDNIVCRFGLPGEIVSDNDAVHNNEELRLNLDLLEERQECATIREAKEKLKMTKYYNTRVRGVTFRPRDFVYRSNKHGYPNQGGWHGTDCRMVIVMDGSEEFQNGRTTVYVDVSVYIDSYSVELHLPTGWQDLEERWKDLMRSPEALEDGAYMLRSMDGTVLPWTWNVANLKKYYL